MNEPFLTYRIVEKVCKAVCECLVDDGSRKESDGAFFGCLKLDGKKFRGLFTSCRLLRPGPGPDGGRGRLTCKFSNEQLFSFTPPGNGLRFYDETLDVGFFELDQGVIEHLASINVSILECEFPPASSASTVHVGQPILVGQFPDGEDLKIMAGRVTDVSSADPPSRKFTHDIPVDDFFRFSPVADYSGRLVGIQATAGEVVTMDYLASRISEVVRGNRAEPLATDFLSSYSKQLLKSAVCEVSVREGALGGGCFCKIQHGPAVRFGLLTSSAVLNLEILTICSTLQCQFLDGLELQLQVSAYTMVLEVGDVVFLEIDPAMRKELPERTFLPVRRLRAGEPLFCFNELLLENKLHQVEYSNEPVDWQKVDRGKLRAHRSSAGAPLVTPDCFLVAICAELTNVSLKFCAEVPDFGADDKPDEPIWHVTAAVSEANVEDRSCFEIVNSRRKVFGFFCKLPNPIAHGTLYGVMTHNSVDLQERETHVECRPLSAKVAGTVKVRFTYVFSCPILGVTFFKMKTRKKGSAGSRKPRGHTAVDASVFDIEIEETNGKQRCGFVFLEGSCTVKSFCVFSGVFPDGSFRFKSVLPFYTGIHLHYDDDGLIGTPLFGTLSRQAEAVHKGRVAGSDQCHAVVMHHVWSAILLDRHFRKKSLPGPAQWLSTAVDSIDGLKFCTFESDVELLMPVEVTGNVPVRLRRTRFFWYWCFAQKMREEQTMEMWIRISQCEPIESKTRKVMCLDVTQFEELLMRVREFDSEHFWPAVFEKAGESTRQTRKPNRVYCPDPRLRQDEDPNFIKELVQEAALNSVESLTNEWLKMRDKALEAALHF